MNAKIYYLENPQTKQPFYVGATGGTLEERFSGHINANKKVIELISAGIFPSIELIEEVPGNISGKTESYWIEQFRAWGFKLSNSKRGCTANIPPYNNNGEELDPLHEKRITDYSNSEARFETIQKAKEHIERRRNMCLNGIPYIKKQTRPR